MIVIEDIQEEYKFNVVKILPKYRIPKKRKKSKAKTTEQFVYELSIKNPNLILIGEYINSNTKALFRYKDCWHTDWVNPSSALRGTCGCPICRKSKMSKIMKKSQKDYENELAFKNPNVILIGEYIGGNIKTEHKCLIHNITWFITPNNALKGTGCKECGKEKISVKLRKSKDQYIKELSISCPNVVLVGEYFGTETKTSHKCLTCGYIWDTRPAILLNPEVMFGCPKCADKYLAQQKAFSLDEYKERVSIVNPNIEVLGNTYINSFTTMFHKCLICGNIWGTNPNAILNGHGCPECAKVAVSIARSKSPEQFVKDFYDKNPSSDCIELLEEYKGSGEQIKCKCLLCNNIWYPTADGLLQGQGCPVCKSSFGEQIIARYLQRNNIPYKLHKTFNNLFGTDGGKLSYDFYLPSLNTLIEMQGKQHAEPIEFFGGVKQFEKQKEHDKRKREYAANNGYIFLEIWYNENIEQKLNEYLNLETVETAVVA